MDIGRNFDRRLRGVMLMVILLRTFRISAQYPYALVKDMKMHKSHFFSSITKNDIYNAISMLESRGFISYKMKNGKKYYATTKKGNDLLKHASAELKRSLIEVGKLIG
jgi:DNA-binding PadR family transcriptional regulator